VTEKITRQDQNKWTKSVINDVLLLLRRSALTYTADQVSQH